MTVCETKKSLLVHSEIDRGECFIRLPYPRSTNFSIRPKKLIRSSIDTLHFVLTSPSTHLVIVRLRMKPSPIHRLLVVVARFLANACQQCATTMHHCVGNVKLFLFRILLFVCCTNQPDFLLVAWFCIFGLCGYSGERETHMFVYCLLSVLLLLYWSVWSMRTANRHGSPW